MSPRLPRLRGSRESREEKVVSRKTQCIAVFSTLYFPPSTLCVLIAKQFGRTETVGLEPTNGVIRRLFSRQVPHPVGWLPKQLRGLESNQRTRGSKPRISTNRNYPASKVPCGNRTRLSRLEVWHLCHSAKGTRLPCCHGSRESRGEKVESRKNILITSARLPTFSPLLSASKSPCD